MESAVREHLNGHRYREAFELLLELYQNKVFRLAWGMLQDKSRAEDLTQEVFLKTWKALPHFKGISSLSTWIYSITRNTCLTEICRTRRKQMWSLDDPGISTAAHRVRSVHRQETTRVGELDIQAMMRRLPEKYRRVITLYYLEERSYEEAAAMLAMPLGTVKTYIHRARKQLAAMNRVGSSGCLSCNVVN